MFGPDPQDERTMCPKCGGENFAFASFCISCGASLSGEIEPDANGAGLIGQPPHAQITSTPQDYHGLLDFVRARWEVLAGMLVLLLVIGYVLYDWQRSTAQSEAYRDGIAAAESKEWDRAVASFEQAGEYLSSERREKEARQKVAERDRLYSEGLAAITREDWKAGIAPLQRLQEVQPAYRDTIALLSQATNKLLNDGLAHIAYTVDGDPSPGLYIRDEQGRANMLPGSDRHSVVRAISPDGNSIVYDRPSKEIDYIGPSWDHNPVLRDPFGQDRSDRVLVLATNIWSAKMDTLPLPQLDRGGKGIFTDGGLWWYSSRQGDGLFGYEVSYRGINEAGISEVVRVSDLANGKRVLAVDPPHSQVVITEAKGNARGDDRETALYLTNAMGKDVRFLQTVQGEIYQASFSPDGQWLLYLTQQNGASWITRMASVLRLDADALVAGRQPVPQLLRSLTWSGIEMDTRLSAAFVPAQSGPTRVIVNHLEYGTEHLLVHNLGAGTVDVLWRERADGAYRRDLWAFSHDGEYMASRRQKGSEATIRVDDLRPRSHSWNSTPLPASNSQLLKAQFAPLDDYVIIGIQNEAGINRGHSQRVYSLPNEDVPTGNGARLMAEADWPYDTDLPTTAMPANGSMFIYVNTQRELRAVFYDGTGDTLVAGNVKAVWSLRGRRDLSWWR